MKARIRAGPYPAPENPLEGIEAEGALTPPREHGQRGGTAVLGIAIVLTTFAATAVEFAHAYDGMRGDAATLQAQALGLEASNRLVTSQQQALSQFETFVIADQQRSNAATANQWLINPQAGISSSTALREKTRWNQIAAATEGLTDISKNDPTGPQQDPAFPDQYLEKKSTGDADRAWALQNAANEEATRWRDVTAKHAAVLTMLAIAVYLFGLSLTVKLRINRYLSILGLILLVVGSSWSMILQVSPIQRASDAAATEFAQARISLAAAYWQGSSGYADALNHYTRAIKSRPTFAQAYHERALVEFTMGSPQTQQSILNFSSAEALAKATDDDFRAYSLGLKNNDVLTNLGNDYFLQGLQSRQSQFYARALGYTAEALRSDPKDPLLSYNRAVELFASGRVADAKGAYAEAVADTLAKWVNDADMQESLLAGALTDLELVAKYRADLAQPIQTIKQLLVSGVLGPALIGPARQVAALQAQIFPAFVEWTAHLPDIDSTGDIVSVQWYYAAPAATATVGTTDLWSVLPKVSGNLPFATANSDPYGNLWPDSSGPSNYFNVNKYLQPSGHCLAAGRYRAEVYLNGHPTVSAETTFDTVPLTGQTVPDLGVQLCRPQSWQLSTAGDRGFTEGYVSPDGKSGVYIFRYEHSGAQGDTAAVVSADLQRTMSVYGDRFPGRASFLKVDNYQIYDLESHSGAFYSYSGGEIDAIAGFRSRDIDINGHTVTIGATIIIAVFGSSNYIEGADPSGLFESLIVN